MAVFEVCGFYKLIEMKLFIEWGKFYRLDKEGEGWNLWYFVYVWKWIFGRINWVLDKKVLGLGEGEWYLF